MDDWIVGLMQINPGDSVNVSLYQRAKVYSLPCVFAFSELKINNPTCHGVVRIGRRRAIQKSINPSSCGMTLCDFFEALFSVV